MPYQQSVELTWKAYKESVADLGGSDPSKDVKTTTSSGSSSVTLYTYATGTSKTAVQVPVTVSVTISGTTYQASPLSVSVSPASAPSFAVHEEDYFDPDDFSEAVDGATGRYAGKLSAITIEGSNGGSVYENGSRVRFVDEILCLRCAQQADLQPVFPDLLHQHDERLLHLHRL